MRTYGRPHINEVIFSGELVAIFAQPQDRETYDEDSQRHVFLFHQSVRQPVQELPQPEPFFDGHDFMRYDWSPGDSSHLAIYWALSIGSVTHVAVMSRKTTGQREVSALTPV